MRILLASSEVFPFSKTGGLADMVGALGKALAQSGHEVVIITPLYRGIHQKFGLLEKVDFNIHLPLGDRWETAHFLAKEIAPGCQVYFLDHPALYDRASIYGEGGKDYPDNDARYTFLAKAVALFARYGSLQPEVIHLHDWQVALTPLLVKRQAAHEGWVNPPATVLTIHNLAYQGYFPPASYELTNLPQDYYNLAGVEFFGGVNFLKAGIVYADLITTVSPRYAREITTEAYGCGLDGALRARGAALVGILNGVDYSEWRTEENAFLPVSYSARDLSGKKELKRLLQKEAGLPIADNIPLFGTVSRLADQKGIDIQIPALEEMLASEMQFILLGSGDPGFEAAFLAMARRYPQKVAVRIGYDHALAHRIEAGCDFFLMPSRFEPCGLNQMYSLRYGTIPVVRVTGGLDDSVIDINEDSELADGIKFIDYSARALTKAIRKALVLYQRPDLMDHFRRNGMNVDFSWEQTTAEYTKAFRRAVETKWGI